MSHTLPVRPWIYPHRISRVADGAGRAATLEGFDRWILTVKVSASVLTQRQPQWQKFIPGHMLPT